MTQVAPFLKTDSKSKPTESAAAVDRDSLNLPRVPLAGFWRRLGAVVLDLLILYFASRLLASALRGPLLSLGPWNDIVGIALITLYFALGNGPVGKGRTVGKFLVGIRTTRKDGSVPTFTQGLLRFSILFCGPIFRALIAPTQGHQAEFSVTHALIWWVPLLGLFAMLVASVFAIVFNPFKQGLHDFVAQTLVRPANAPSMAFEEIAALVGDNWRRYYRQPQVTGWATFVLLFGLLLVLAVRTDVPDTFAAKYAAEQSLISDDFYRHVHLEGRLLPTEEELQTAEGINAWLTDLYDDTSTRTLMLSLKLRRQGDWNMEDPGMMGRLETLAAGYHERVVGASEPESFLRESPDGVSLQNLRSRPVLLRVILIEALSLGFPNFVLYDEAGRFEFLQQPLEPLPARESAAEPEEGLLGAVEEAEDAPDPTPEDDSPH